MTNRLIQTARPRAALAPLPCARCTAPALIVDAHGVCALCLLSSRSLRWGRPAATLIHLPDAGRAATLDAVRRLACDLTRSTANYQRLVIRRDLWSGASLKGNARGWGVSYARSRAVAADHVWAAAAQLGVSVVLRCGERDINGVYRRDRHLDLACGRMAPRAAYDLAYPPAPAAEWPARKVVVLP